MLGAMGMSRVNIGPRGRTRRLLVGVAGFAAGIALAAVLSLADATPWLKPLVFIPLAGGAYGFFQYREKT